MNPIAVIDPKPSHLKSFSELYKIPEKSRFTNLKNLPIAESAETFCLIMTPDVHHVVAAKEAVSKGYKMILMEKPMATNLNDCQELVELFERKKVTVGVCHVLRGSFANQKIKELLEKGKVGQVLSCRHIEPVGYRHFAHSYVRGNWRKESECGSSFLLAKCCHDLDLIHWWFGENSKISSIYSVGDLQYFKKANKPNSVADHVKRCVDCPIKLECAYSAVKFYDTDPNWANTIITDGLPVTPKNISTALSTGPYGRCVYECDNDVCDTQQVTIKFEKGPIVDFHSVATSLKRCTRTTEIYGSLGQLVSEDPSTVVFTDFETREQEVFKLVEKDSVNSDLSGHGGCDGRFVDDLILALETGENPKTNPGVTIFSHKMAFAAERSRKENRVVVDL